jgi:hypothetical protein
MLSKSFVREKNVVKTYEFLVNTNALEKIFRFKKNS